MYESLGFEYIHERGVIRMESLSLNIVCDKTKGWDAVDPGPFLV
ncbi:hypothetical protein [Pontibacillus sp. ALD_SL1]|nr:hypothetical protein [Pontibacillus sp. ALD_SL1]